MELNPSSHQLLCLARSFYYMYVTKGSGLVGRTGVHMYTDTTIIAYISLAVSKGLVHIIGHFIN